MADPPRQCLEDHVRLPSSNEPWWIPTGGCTVYPMAASDFQEIHWKFQEQASEYVKGSKGLQRTDMNEQISTEKGPSSLVILGFFAINRGNLKFQRLGTVKACSQVFQVCFFLSLKRAASLKHDETWDLSHLYLLESWLTSWIMSSLSPRTNTTFCAFAAAGDCR